ncbi:MAG: NAD-binding protein [Atopobiaceae bacterium]|nr:NAD-binding protein [Atopobiaceae bacterium]MCI2208146.1 NAD-binding protein [Atopobiaceae bacterium]
MDLPRRHSVMVVGCGVLGASLATKLSCRGYDVCAIDEGLVGLENLGDDFSGFTDVGDGSSAEVLERNGIENASVVLALTGHDNTNILIAEQAKACYGVEKVYARLFDEAKARLIEPMGIGALCPRRLCEDQFASMSGIVVPEDDDL